MLHGWRSGSTQFNDRTNVSVYIWFLPFPRSPFLAGTSSVVKCRGRVCGMMRGCVVVSIVVMLVRTIWCHMRWRRRWGRVFIQNHLVMFLAVKYWITHPKVITYYITQKSNRTLTFKRGEGTIIVKYLKLICKTNSGAIKYKSCSKDKCN